MSMYAAYVVQVGSADRDPQWMTITWPIHDRVEAIRVMNRQATQLPQRFDPHGSRRLRVMPCEGWTDVPA